MEDERKPKQNNEPPKKAVALQYEPGKHPAPAIVATGSGPVAEKIIALAKEHGVPVKEDAELVQLLASLDVGKIIPPELYVAVAEVLVFVYQMNKKYCLKN